MLNDEILKLIKGGENIRVEFMKTTFEITKKFIKQDVLFLTEKVEQFC